MPNKATLPANLNLLSQIKIYTRSVLNSIHRIRDRNEKLEPCLITLSASAIRYWVAGGARGQADQPPSQPTNPPHQTIEPLRL